MKVEQLFLLGVLVQKTSGATDLIPASDAGSHQIVKHSAPDELFSLSKHTFYLGKLIANLQSLEFVIRIFLSKLPDSQPMGIPYGADIYSYPVGTKFLQSAVTDYSPLGKLVDRFNTGAMAAGLTQRIAPTIVDIRDALAHGRLSAPASGGEMRIIKFGRPDAEGKVEMTYNELMDHKWFKRHVKQVYEALIIVVEADAHLEQRKKI